MDIAEIFRLNYNVAPEAVADFLEAATIEHFNKGDKLVDQGKYDERLYLVKEGIMMMWFLKNGEEETICFGEAGCGFMSFNSYYQHGPSHYACSAMTPLDAYCITFKKLDELMEIHVSLLWWFLKAMVEEFYLMECRSINYRTQDAYTRFKFFMSSRSNIYKVVPARYIAQYLRVRPETLYRLRARLLREKK